MAKARIKVEDKIAQEIGEVFADFFIAIGEAVRTTLQSAQALADGRPQAVGVNSGQAALRVSGLRDGCQAVHLGKLRS